MELRHLRYFVAVAEERNISRAAARLHLTQPSLSRQIRDLEYFIDVVLFDRSDRRLRLTDAGHAFLHEARALLQRADEAVEMARAIAMGELGEINVGFAPSLTVDLLPRALRQFHQSCPGVRVHLHDRSTREMVCGLRDGKLQVALMIRPTEKQVRGIHFEPLRRFPICVAAHPSHPLVRSLKVGLGDVARERLIAYSREDYPEYHSWLRGLFAGGLRPPTVAEEHDSSTSLIASVEAGRGIALVQQGFESLSGLRLMVRPLSPAPPPFVVGLARLPDGSSAITEAFCTAVRNLA